MAFTDWLHVRSVQTIAKLTHWNESLAGKFKTTRERVFQVELAGSFGFGFTMMQIGEWGLAVGVWVFLGFILLLKSFSWEGINGAKGITLFARSAFVFCSLFLCVLLITITHLHKPDNEPWSNLQKLWAHKERKVEPITPENVEERIVTWYHNLGIFPRSVDSPSAYFALDVRLDGDHHIGISRPKNQPTYLVITATVFMGKSAKARFDTMSHDQQQQLSDDVNLDVARIPMLEYEYKFPNYIKFNNPIPITQDLTQHQFMEATKPVIHAVTTIEASIDAHSRQLGTPLRNPRKEIY